MQRNVPIAIAKALVLVVFMVAAAPARAQDARGQVVVDPTVPRPGIDPTTGESSEGTQLKTASGVTPLFAPIPFKDSQLGWGLFLLAGVIHRFDPDTTLKPSTGIVGGFYTENKSWGWMVGEMARLSHDRWRLRGLVSHVDVRYDFFGIGEDAGQAGQSIALEQKMDFAVGSALRRVREGLYLGGSVIWMRTTVGLRSPPAGLPPPSSDDLARTDLFAPGMQVELDTRDDDYWPRAGSLANLRASFFSEDLGSARDFQRYMASWSWYTRLRNPALTLATNVNGAAAAGDAPFYMLPTIGGGLYGLRGYQQGRYRDQVMTTLQAELRFHTAGRFGATVFGGFGQVAPSIGELTEARVFPAGGAGVRYQLTRQYPMHLRADYAWGVDEGLLYFSVSEAF
jgi:Omp85 superfamily domain